MRERKDMIRSRMADHDRPLEVECRRAMVKWQHLEAWLLRSDKDVGADYDIGSGQGLSDGRLWILW